VLRLPSDIAERRVTLEHRIGRWRALFHLKVVVHERHGFASTLIRRPGRSGNDSGEGCRLSGKCEVGKVDCELHALNATVNLRDCEKNRL
jgi:hypothetical protein